jgi:hypothetical protein
MANNTLISLLALALSGCMPDNSVRDPDECPATVHRITGIAIPSSTLDSLTTAFDLDGDNVRDNWLGFANTVVHAWDPSFDLSPDLATLDWRLSIHSCSPTGPTSAALTTTSDDAESARGIPGAPLTGGTFALPLGTLSDPLGTSDPKWVAAPLAQLRLDSATTATVGLAITTDDLQSIVAPNLAAYFTAHYTSSDFAASADTNHDRTISTDELLASEAAQVLLAPDLSPQLDLPTGGASLGFTITAY